jgi:adenosylcobinamide-phosphate synthase
VGVALGVAAGMVIGETAPAVYLAVAARSLRDTAEAVGTSLAAGDLAEARRRLPSLVGRDPSDLDEGEIARAVVESLAENTVDAVVAPCLWAVVAGARGALAYRAINTLDAMVGHRSTRYERFGWASARADDVANWIPARVTAALVVAVRPGRAGEVWRAVREDAPGHPSPNSGVAEAAWAGALGVRLGGTNRYGTRFEVRPALGAGPGPGAADIARASALSRDVTAALGALLVMSALPCARTRLRRGAAG